MLVNGVRNDSPNTFGGKVNSTTATSVADRPLVIHVGILGDLPGGMAQVVNQYLVWSYSSVVVRGLLSTKGRHDPLAIFRWFHCIWELLRARFSGVDTGVVVHVSAKGSFVREGSLVLFARLIGLGVGIHVHGSEFASFASRYPGLVRLISRNASSVFVLTDETGGIIRELLGAARPSRIVKVMNAVTVPELPELKEPLVLFCGEVGERKGADVLLAAWSNVSKRVSGWKLVMAGPILLDVSDYREVDATDLPGAVSHADSLELQRRASVAVLPSRHEALPMFLIEAMARGCAVVSTTVGQIAELVEGTESLLVPAGDVSELENALELLMLDGARRTASGRLARERIKERYSEEAVKGTLEKEWLRMMDSKGGNR